MILVAGLAGCSKKDEQPPPVQQNKPEQKRPVPVQKQHSSAQAAPVAVSEFNFSGKKDPFKPVVTETKKAQPQPVFQGVSHPLLPIQNYEVNQFRVLGIVTGLKENSALVVDPAGKAYVVRPGMEIGKFGGRIVRISNTAIEVLERFRDEDGRVKKRTARITLPRKEQGDLR
jgi:type IV pilus assembly protein PilP